MEHPKKRSAAYMISPNLSPPANRLHLVPISITTEVLREKHSLHFHNFTQIFYVMAGQFPHTIGDKTYTQTPGSCAAIFPYTAHTPDSVESDANPIYICISFPDNFLTNRGYNYFSYANTFANFEGLQIPLFSKFNGKDKEKADILVRKMSDEFRRHKNMSLDIIAETLAEFLRFLCHNAPDGAQTMVPTSSIIERANAINNAVTYIAEHYNEKIPIDALASIAAMSRRSFFRNFEKITGTTVSQLTLLFRLKNALPPLVYTEKPLDEIAREVGLYDKSRFSHAFSEVYGVSPAKYRETQRPVAFKKVNYNKRQWTWLEKQDNE